MNDFTKEFLTVCDNRRRVSIYSDCTDGSAECAEYTYESSLANLKHLIEGKNWQLTSISLIIVITKGNSYTSSLDEAIRDYDSRTDYKFEVEE